MRKFQESKACHPGSGHTLARGDEVLKVRRLFDDKFCCLVRKDHPQIGGRLSLEKYAELNPLSLLRRQRIEKRE